MDDRGVSMPLQYALLVSIIALLAGGLFVTTGGFVENQRTDAVEHGLEVVGARLATDIAAADRLADDLDGTGSLDLAVETPNTVAGSTYVVTVTPIEGTDSSEIILESGDTDVKVTVEISTTHPVTTSSVAGGDVTISYDGTSLEVRDG